MFNLFCPTLHEQNVLDVEACLTACSSSKEVDDLPTQPVVNELNTEPCCGFSQHKKQECSASGNVSQAQIPELTRPAMGYKEQDVHSGIAKGTPSHTAQPVTQVVKIPEQDFYNWLDKEICMEDIMLPEHKYKKDKQNTEETLSVTDKPLSTNNLMNMMMLIVLWSTMVVIMKRRYDPQILPCRCKEMKSEKNFAKTFLTFWEKKNKFGEKLNNLRQKFHKFGENLKSTYQWIVYMISLQE